MTAINSLEVIFAIWDSDDRLVFENEFFCILNESILESYSVGATFEEHINAVAEHDLIGDVKDNDARIVNRLKRHQKPDVPF
ncbi:hypothetical protein OAA86_08605 [Rhodospirillales bacterium]|nr:hypothetical protein [Rhodospirillales bacterium]